MKNLFLLILSIFSVIRISAQIVSYEVAKMKASDFFFATEKTVLPLKSSLMIEVDSFATYYTSKKNQLKSTSLISEPAFYIFNRIDKPGFVIVSGDKRIKDIIAYSTTSVFENPNPGLKALLNQYVQEISYAKENNISTNILLAENKSAAIISGNEGEWLLGNIEWDQNPKPFNELCPADPNAIGYSSNYSGVKHVPAGCVATAMAQIIYYYKYPRHGVGNYGYYSYYGYEYADFENTEYKYNLMKDKPTYYVRNDEIATLLYHCGVSVDMEYGTEGSSAEPISKVETSLESYFNYKDCSVKKDNILSFSWEETIKNEIVNGRPVYYEINNLNPFKADHAFVVDGYDFTFGEIFHINWGWGGSNNAWYSLNALNTNNGNYSSTGQRMIIGIEPKDFVDLIPINQSLSSNMVQAGDNIIAFCAEENKGNTSSSSNNVTFWLSLDEVLREQEDIKLNGQITFPSLTAKSESPILSSTVSIPSSIPPGNYHFFFWADGNKEVTEINDDNNFATGQLTITAPSANPTLIASLSSLAFGNVTVSESSIKNFTISGSDLTGNVSVSVSGTGFAISKSESSGFSTSTLSFSPSGGTVSGTVYVRFSPTSIGSKTGSISVTSSGASSKSVLLSGAGVSGGSAPSNDNSCSPQPLAIRNSCDYEPFTTINATTQAIKFMGKTNEYQPSRYDDDVWFSIKPSSSSEVTITVKPTSNLSNFDIVLGLYQGSCSNPTQIQIGQGVAGNAGDPESIIFTPQANITYLIRVFSYGMESSSSGNFDICVTGESINNDCSTFSLSQTSVEFPYTGGNGSFIIYTGDGCDWSVALGAYQYEIANITSNTTGSGTYTVTYQVDANPSNESRSTLYVVAGEHSSISYIIFQDGIPSSCSAPSAPATFNASIGEPANGLNNYTNFICSQVAGAEGYSFEYSYDGKIWNDDLLEGSFNDGWRYFTGYPNYPIYYRVRAYNCNPKQYSSYTYATPQPIYTACNDPAKPTVNGATSNSLNVTLNSETHAENPAYTNYSIYCTTTGKYVQSNGTLGNSEVFKTKAEWGTNTVTGLSENTQYCFYAKAKNNDGDIRFNASNSACGTTTSIAAPLATASTNITQNSFTANWNPSPNATGYRLDIAMDNEFTNFLVGYQNKDVGNVTTLPITGLQAGTTYYYRVKAYNSSGTSDNSNSIIVLLEMPPKTIDIMAGGLNSALTTDEKNTITSFTITGNIDARDFKTMRDEMPLLVEIDLSGATIVAYNGTEGTSTMGNNNYLPNVIPESAFDYKFSLISFKFPTSVTSIENRAFRNCNSLGNLILPPSVTVIKPQAFESCSSLGSIIFPTSVISIGGSAFYSTDLTTVTIPSSVTLIGDLAFFSVQSIVVEASNPNYSSIEGALYNKTQSSLLQCPVSKTGSFTIPSSVTLIGIEAFLECRYLTSVNIPSSVNSIEYGAFINCKSLTSISIPASVTSIGNDSFAGCEELISINVYRTAPLDLSPYPRVFNNVDKSNCTLYVPYGTKAAYEQANQWQDFENIVEMPGFSLSSTTANIEATEGSTTNLGISSNVIWNASTDQSWLAISPITGTDIQQTVTFTAEANPTIASRIAVVTISADGVESQNITVTQASVCSLALSLNNLYFTATAGNKLVDVTSNSSWAVSDDATWITVSPTSGSNDGTLTISVTSNTGSQQSGTVTVTGCNTNKTILVTQAGSSVSPPTIIVSTTSLPDFGSVLVNSNSTAQSFTVSGSNLTSNISLTAPAGFEISKSSGSGYGSSLSLTQAGGSVSSTTIYVRFSPTSEGSKSGEISVSSTGATTINVLVIGTGTQECIAPSAPSVFTLAIGEPANGLEHHLDAFVSEVFGVDGYSWDYSIDGVNWTINYYQNISTSGNWNLGDSPNQPIYWRVRSFSCIDTLYSSYTYAAPQPIYTACDDPAIPTVNGATSNSLNITLNAETPVENPAYTNYSIYCTTTDKYVQSDGTLGNTDVFMTKAEWGTKEVTGLVENTQYCFYIKARNGNGDIRFNSLNSACAETENAPVCNLSFSPDNLDFSEAAEMKPITITSNSTWTVSDNASWITVSSLSGNGNGTLEITVTANSGEERNGTVTIEGCNENKTIMVTQDKHCTPPPAPSIGPITQPTCDLPAGSVFLYNLPATGSWTLTSNPEGITATGTETGTTITGLASGIYSFTVTNAEGCTSATSGNIEINAIEIPPTPIIDFRNDTTIYSDVANGNQWYNENGIIDGATNQEYIPKTSGRYYVIVTNEYGCKSEPSDISNYTKTNSSNEFIINDLKIYPNPTSGLLNIEGLPENKSIEIALYDMKNSLIKKYNSHSSIAKINISDVVPGTYLLVINNQIEKTVKIIKE